MPESELPKKKEERGEIPSSIEFISRNEELKLSVEGPVHLIGEEKPRISEGDWKLNFFWIKQKPNKAKKEMKVQIIGSDGRITKISWRPRAEVRTVGEEKEKVVHPASPHFDEIPSTDRKKLIVQTMRTFETMRESFEHPEIYRSCRMQLFHALNNWEVSRH